MLEVLDVLRRGHALAIAFAAYALGVVSITGGIALLCAGAFALVWCALPAPISRAPEFRSIAGFILCGFVAGALGAVLALHESARTPFATLSERHVTAVVVAIERPKPAPGGASMRVRVVRVSAPAGPAASSLRGALALLETPDDGRLAHVAGRELTVRARLSLPAGSRNEGEPSQRDLLAEEGVSTVLAAHSNRDIAVGANASGWEAWWARLRARCVDAVEMRLPPLEATVLEGILWGDRGNLPASFRQEFSDTGTVHVLTTAGLHLGILAALVSWLLSRLPLPRPVRTALVVAAAWAYAALAGLHMPTVRAATMLTAGSVALESGRGRTPSAVLATAAFAVVLPHPLVLLTPSFAMSFACVGGIALLTPALSALGMRDGGGLLSTLAELVRTSTAVQIAMWPLQALYFNAFTPYAVIANVLVVPLVGIVMALGAAMICAGFLLPALAAPLGNLTWWAVDALIGAVEKFASLPTAHVDVPPPTHAFLILYWCGLGALAWVARPGQRVRLARWVGPAVAALGFVYCIPGIAAALDPRLHLDAIDVGQADCLLIRAPGWHAMLVDGGGKLERAGAAGTVVAQPIGDVIATRTVMPYLLRHWVVRLDAVVLTHPHGDHAGGLPVILQRERVGVLYDSAQLYGGPSYQRALNVVRDRHLAYRVARRGQTFDLGPQTHVAILAPELPLITGTSSDINNNSVVLRVDFGHIAMLLTGDAQAEAEARLLSHGGADLRAEVLKVGHHGSAYSSTPAFLAAVHPRIAIISCGLHNVFGHPSPRTLAALRAAGAAVYRTDIDGGISVTVAGPNR